jgi:hypothetical protein
MSSGNTDAADKPTTHKTTSPLDRKIRSSIAAISTFLFSGIIQYAHIVFKTDFSEYYAWVAFRDGFPGTNLAFFAVHGLSTTLQVLSQSLWPGLKAKQIPKLVKIIGTTLIILLTTPLFQDPYLRGELYVFTLTPAGVYSRYLHFKVPYIPGLPHSLAHLWMQQK